MPEIIASLAACTVHEEEEEEEGSMVAVTAGEDCRCSPLLGNAGEEVRVVLAEEGADVTPEGVNVATRVGAVAEAAAPPMMAVNAVGLRTCT